MSVEPPLRSYSFSADARCCLRKNGLIDEQIAELEKVLPFCWLDIEDAPQLGDVRSELTKTTRAIKTTLDRVERLLPERNVSWPAAREAMNWIHKASSGEIDAAREALAAQEALAACDAERNRNEIDAAREALNRAHAAGGGCHEIEHAQEALAALNRVITGALADLRTEQTRTKAASPRPIERIFDALLRGWRQGAGGRAFNLAPEPEYPDDMARITPKSRGHAKRKFERIVQICYETIGAPRDYVPERAIRAFRRSQTVARARRDAMVQKMRDKRPSENPTSRP